MDTGWTGKTRSEGKAKAKRPAEAITKPSGPQVALLPNWGRSSGCNRACRERAERKKTSFRLEASLAQAQGRTMCVLRCVPGALDKQLSSPGGLGKREGPGRGDKLH